METKDASVLGIKFESVFSKEVDLGGEVLQLERCEHMSRGLEGKSVVNHFVQVLFANNH